MDPRRSTAFLLLVAGCSDYHFAARESVGGRPPSTPSASQPSSTAAPPSGPTATSTTVCDRGPISVHPLLSGKLAVEDVAGITVQGEGDGLGNSVAIDDLDADGVPEILVAGAGADQTGVVRIFSCPGPGEYASASADRTWTGITARDRPFAEVWVASAGDADGDGTRDVALTTEATPEGQPGTVFLMSGIAPTTDFSSSLATWTRGDVDGTAFSAGRGDGFGGDDDGDGFDDELVNDAGDGYQAGIVWLVRGPVQRGDHAVEDVATATLTRGPGEWDGFGLEHTGLDWDGDGLRDVVVQMADGGATPEGAGTIFVFLGPVSGALDATAARATFAGEHFSQDLGYGLRAAPDLDGDGLDDLLAKGFALYDPGPSMFGFRGGDLGTVPLASALFSVTPDPSTADGVIDMAALDLDDDGVSDVAASVASDAVPSTAGTTWLLRGPLAGAVTLEGGAASIVGHSELGRVGASLAAGGDVDQDGFQDLLIGGTGYGDPDQDDGAAFLVFGAWF